MLTEKVFNISQDTKILGENITKFTVNQALPHIIKKRELSSGEIDWFVPHYSSNYFKEKLVTALKDLDFEIPIEKWFTTIESKGNIGSASLYIYMHDLVRKHKDDFKNGQKILCFIPESSRFSVAYVMLTVIKE